MTFKVVIANTGTTVDCSADQTVLQAAIAGGVDFPYTCATGNCAACVTELRTGAVSMLAYSDNALTLDQRAAGKILACRARPCSNLELIWLGRGRR